MAEVATKRRRREPVDLPERKCAYPKCEAVFKPIRRTQRFHTTPCKKAYWAEAYHWTTHPCPLCTVVHDPSERPMLDALEHLINEHAQTFGMSVAVSPQVSTVVLRSFIAARRETLRG